MTIAQSLPIPSGRGFRLWWPLYFALAFLLPPLFLFVPIRAPTAVAFLGLVILLHVVARRAAFVAEPFLRGPHLAR